MIEQRIRCNECGVKGCKSYDSTSVSKGCRMFTYPAEFKTPLLVHLMDDDKATNTMKVLEHFGFLIEEIGTYPYFKLNLKGRK